MKWLDKLKTMKKDKLILLILAGILLVVIKLPAKNTVKTKSYEYNIQNSAADKTTTDYGTSMEKQLEELLSSVTGVGKNMQNVKEGENYTQKTENNDYPEILGVLIVAKGAGDMKVVSEITDAVSALLGISANKIRVLKMEA